MVVKAQAVLCLHRIWAVKPQPCWEVKRSSMFSCTKAESYIVVLSRPLNCCSQLVARVVGDCTNSLAACRLPAGNVPEGSQE